MSAIIPGACKFVVFLTLTSVLIMTGCKKSSVKVETVSSTTTSKDQSLSRRVANPIEFIVDQSNITLTNSFSYNINIAPMAQEFVPAFHALDAVELKLDDASCSLSGSDGGNLKVIIREGTITGKTIGTSETVHFVNCFYGVLRFNFPEIVKLTTGETYVLEASYVSGHTSALWVNEGVDSYVRGNFIMGGSVRPGKDAWFQEGLVNFIARTKEQMKTVGWEKLVRRDGTSFKNKGDCMQYINTGS